MDTILTLEEHSKQPVNNGRPIIVVNTCTGCVLLRLVGVQFCVDFAFQALVNESGALLDVEGVCS